MNRLLRPVKPVVGAARHLLWYLRYHSSVGDQRANRQPPSRSGPSDAGSR